MSLLKAGRPSEGKKPLTLNQIREKKVRLNVDIDKTLLKKLKQQALNEDKRMADIVRELLNKHL